MTCPRRPFSTAARNKVTSIHMSSRRPLGPGGQVTRAATRSGVCQRWRALCQNLASGQLRFHLSLALGCRRLPELQLLRNDACVRLGSPQQHDWVI